MVSDGESWRMLFDVMVHRYSWEIQLSISQRYLMKKGLLWRVKLGMVYDFMNRPIAIANDSQGYISTDGSMFHDDQ